MTRIAAADSSIALAAVMAGLVPAISLIETPRQRKRDRRDTSAFTRVFDALLPGDDNGRNPR
jgi:hypothetical protein